jgi:hypothetical protein
LQKYYLVTPTIHLPKKEKWITGRTQLLINRLLYKDYYEQWIPKQEIKEEKNGYHG